MEPIQLTPLEYAKAYRLANPSGNTNLDNANRRYAEKREEIRAYQKQRYHSTKPIKPEKPTPPVRPISEPKTIEPAERYSKEYVQQYQADYYKKNREKLIARATSWNNKKKAERVQVPV